jgi:hypothetical protein
MEAVTVAGGIQRVLVVTATVKAVRVLMLVVVVVVEEDQPKQRTQVPEQVQAGTEVLESLMEGLTA